MRNIILFLFLLPLMAYGQTYKYIGVEDGLSNRRIYNIQKDRQGYMWFLTNEGMDRYNGQDIKHYKLNKEGTILDAPIRLGWFFVKFGGNLFFISTVFFFLNPIKSCRYVCFLVTLKTPHH